MEVWGSLFATYLHPVCLQIIPESLMAALATISALIRIFFWLSAAVITQDNQTSRMILVGETTVSSPTNLSAFIFINFFNVAFINEITKRRIIGI